MKADRAKSRERDAVDAEVVATVDDLDPLVVDLELQIGHSVVVEVGDDPDHDAERHQRREERDPLDQLLFARGMSITMTAPTAGTKTARLSAHSDHSIEFLSLR